MKMAKVEAAIRVTLAYYQALNDHDIAGMVRLISDDCTLETSGPAPAGRLISGKQALEQYWQAFFTETPDAHVEIEDIFGFGRRCVAHWRQEWLDSAGSSTHIRGVDIIRVTDGAICDIRSYVKGGS